METKGIYIPGAIPGPSVSKHTEEKREPVAVRPVRETTGAGPAVISQQMVPQSDKGATLTISKEDAQRIVERLKEELKDLSNIEVDWHFNRDAGVLVVQVKDKESGRILREIPPEQVLEMLEAGATQGIIIDKKA